MYFTCFETVSSVRQSWRIGAFRVRIFREILLTEYIGAILVAVLIADACSALITAVITQVSYHFYLAKRFGVKESLGFSPAYSALQSLVRICIYLTLAYFLARWLYPGNHVSTHSDAESKREPGGVETK
jgi:hypothetical protein